MKNLDLVLDAMFKAPIMRASSSPLGSAEKPLTEVSDG